jgi:hypothetical protein
MFGLPIWLVIAIGIIGAYLVYRYLQYRKSVAYTPKIVRGTDSVISLRDNPPNGG